LIACISSIIAGLFVSLQVAETARYYNLSAEGDRSRKMSFSGDMSRSSSQPTLSQIVALSMTYRRLLALLGFVAVLTIAAPLVSKAAYLVFDRLTNNHTILSLVMTSAATFTVRNLIRQSAPSKQNAEEALAKTEVGLPFLMFLASAFVIQVVVTPLEDGLGIKQILTWSPTITFSIAFRLASGMLILGVAVILRFIGPPSVGTWISSCLGLSISFSFGWLSLTLVFFPHNNCASMLFCSSLLLFSSFDSSFHNCPTCYRVKILRGCLFGLYRRPE
jgi:hypothetical protein